MIKDSNKRKAFRWLALSAGFILVGLFKWVQRGELSGMDWLLPVFAVIAFGIGYKTHRFTERNSNEH